MNVENTKPNMTEDLYDEISFKTTNAVNDIIDWKKHLVRSKNQLRAKNKEIALLSKSRAIIIADWAMKFLPRKFREGQTDSFAKRGINWHIGVCITKSGDGLQTITFVHMFMGQAPQDAYTLASVLCDIFKDLRAMRPEVKEISFYSDNAGCYKSSLTLAMIHANLGQFVTCYNFSEAQDGKGPCDRKASHIKAEIKRYVNEGHNVLDAEDMKKAIDSRGNKHYKCKVVEIGANSKPSVKAIPCISSYSNFLFSDDGITVWKAFGIGKFLCWNQIYENKETMKPCLNIKQMSDNVTFADMKSTQRIEAVTNQENNSATDLSTENEDNDISVCMNSTAESEPSDSSSNEKEIFCCPVDGCVKTFIRHSNLEDHILVGNCTFKLKREPTLDTTKKLYLEKVNSKVEKIFSLSSNTVEARENVVEGWALKVRKPHVNFTKDQKMFLDEKFKIGEVTGKKEDPSSVAEDMRKVKKNGHKRFSIKEFLTPQQIASYFSRLSKKRTEENISAKIEANLNSVQKEILTKLDK